MVLMVVVIVFYFSQRSIRKRGGTVYQQQRGWLESDGVLDVYTVDQVGVSNNLNCMIVAPTTFIVAPQAGQPLNDDAANGYVPSPVRANTHQHRTPVHRPHTHQPPPSYESAVATSLLMDPNANTASPAHTPTMPPSPAVPPMLTSHMMSSIGAQLLFQRQQLVHRSDHHHASPSVHTTRNCCCQQRMRLIERQDYDIIKKCRQCRKQIRPDNEADDDEASNDGEWPTEDYCECLLRNHVTVAAYALGIDDGAEVDRKREERAQQQPPPPQSKLGKLIRATDTERAATATSAAATSSTSLAEQAPSASDVWAHPSMRSRNTEDIADDDDDEDEDGGNDDDDLHARLVSDKLDGATSLDTSGLPSYDAAAKLRPMCDELN